MSPDVFFNLFIEELKNLPELQDYYKFLTSNKKFGFRKNYFLQRLKYIDGTFNRYVETHNKKPVIWDCGCGFGTTAFFLAMNGLASYGSTLEYYFPLIEKRRSYWNQFGNSNLFCADYEDIYENKLQKNSVDIIIVQDTLHHLEPIDKALEILWTTLKPGGMLIVIEENGGNIIQRAKLYKQRGGIRIIKTFDEKLQREVIMGNENIRPFDKWKRLLKTASFEPDEKSVQYIRYYLPFMYNKNNAEQLAGKEQRINNPFLRKYFFFGINFIAHKR
ncbi:MAG: class I SAM-dependent methyltransferase [Sphingobacteriales bacterium]|nr:class I SAM-dependent methyltransferase [Sphingobacteriales bacterium]MBI3717006.1 class I SAM-dependent methyltransferase [Sphingobacteriales bacterium]